MKREGGFWKQEHNHKSKIKSPVIRIKSQKKRERADKEIYLIKDQRKLNLTQKSNTLSRRLGKESERDELLDEIEDYYWTIKK